MTSYRPNIVVVALVVVVAPMIGAGCGRSHVFYDARELRHAPLQSREEHALVEDVAGKVKGRSITWVDPDGKEIAIAADEAGLKKLGLPELGALWLAASTGDLGGENDIRVRTSKTSSVPVSVYTALDGSIRIVSPHKGSSEPPEPNLDEAQIKEKFGLEAKLPGKWHPSELSALAQSLELLAPEELDVVKHNAFDRQAESKDHDLAKAALYEDGGCMGTIFLFSTGVRSDTFRFVGDPSTPRSAILHSIVHEIGHSFEQTAARDRFCASRRAKGDKANELVHQGEQMREESPVIVEYLAALHGDPAPTDYGNTSKHESFAESFALFHVDPDALKRTNPSVYQWFASGGHIKALKAARLADGRG